jgi:hypothetical protein
MASYFTGSKLLELAEYIFAISNQLIFKDVRTTVKNLVIAFKPL